MTDAKQIQCCMITRGMAPAVSVASVVSQVCKRRIPFQIISGRPAVDAKTQAAEIAMEAGRDLLLVEDDIIADDAVWEAVLEHDGVAVASALLRDGTLNTVFYGGRVLYSGTVFLRVPLPALQALGPPWFVSRQLVFAAEGEGHWRDEGPGEHGWYSDCFFYHRCWEANIPVTVVGHVTHMIHPLNATPHVLSEPDVINPLGLVTGQRVKIERCTKTKEACHV